MTMNPAPGPSPAIHKDYGIRGLTGGVRVDARAKVWSRKEVWAP